MIALADRISSKFNIKFFLATKTKYIVPAKTYNSTPKKGHIFPPSNYIAVASILAFGKARGMQCGGAGRGAGQGLGTVFVPPCSSMCVKITLA